jgi:hypothetical protein
MVLLPLDRDGSRKIACGFPAPIGAGETVGAKKGCFWKIFRSSDFQPHRDTTRAEDAKPNKKQKNR